MANKSLISKRIDESIGRLIERKGEFSYEDIEMHVQNQFGPSFNAELIALGRLKFRDRIAERARSLLGAQIKTKWVHPDLFEEDASIVYPVKNEVGKTIFRQLADLTKEDFNDIIRELIQDRKGYDRHIQALRKIERRLKFVWNKQPELTVEEAQQYLNPEAA